MRTALAVQIRLLAIAILLTAAPAARPHWPGQPEHQFADLGEFRFEQGGSIPNLRMSYVTHGRLSPAKDNAILFLHGFAANHHGLDHLVGPGRAIDTDKYFVICPDELGNPQTTFVHSSSPTSTGLRMQFPNYNIRDRVKADYLLVTQALKIPHVLFVTGISSGADAAAQMAIVYPGFMAGIVPISGGGLGTTQFFSFSPLILSSLENCTGWNGGHYERNPKGCAYNAMAVFIPFLYTREWWELYIDSPELYTKWRNNFGDYYLDIQDARDLHYRQDADSRGWLGDTPGFGGDLAAIFGSIKAKTLLLASPFDGFVPKSYYEGIASMIPGAKLTWIESPAGHMMCCNADPNATRQLSAAIQAFLVELTMGSSDEH
jgi:homoserine O-acetyltransferase